MTKYELDEPCSTSEPRVMTERELESHMHALGAEMRPFADVIVGLHKQRDDVVKREGNSPGKRALDKTIQQLEDEFASAFNRDDCFAEYRWPDGLTVCFEGPPVNQLSDGSLKLRTSRVRARAKFTQINQASR